MRDLIEKAGSKKADSAEEVAERVMGELKSAKVRRVNRGGDELYIESGDDEAAVTFDPRRNKAFVRMVIVRPVEATGSAIVDILKKSGIL